MIETYTHDLGNESSEDLLLAYGINVVGSTSATSKENIAKSILAPKTCPHCSEPNKSDARFCMTCRMILTFDEYKATTEALEKRENEMKELKERLDSFERAEQARKEHEAELHETVEKMISRMDNMIIKMYEVNPTMPSLPTKELQDTFASIVGKKKEKKKKGGNDY